MIKCWHSQPDLSSTVDPCKIKTLVAGNRESAWSARLPLETPKRLRESRGDDIDRSDLFLYEAPLNCELAPASDKSRTVCWVCRSDPPWPRESGPSLLVKRSNSSPEIARSLREDIASRGGDPAPPNAYGLARMCDFLLPVLSRPRPIPLEWSCSFVKARRSPDRHLAADRLLQCLASRPSRVAPFPTHRRRLPGVPFAGSAYSNAIHWLSPVVAPIV